MEVKRLQLHRMLLLVAGVVSLFPAASARADIGRKPSMEFFFEYQIDPVDIVAGQLLECDDEECETGEPLESVGPQHFTCTENACSSMAYGYAPHHKLIIEFTDRTRESNVFAKQAFEATYKVTVSESALLVEEVRGGGGGVRGCCSGLLFTLVLETIVAGIYLSLFGLPRVVLGWVPLSSVLSLPVVWFVFPRLAFPAGWVVGLSEAFAVAFETGLIYLATRRTMSLKHVAVLSVVMNAASFLLGLLL
ncbi:MAG: hypothetical protein IMY86_05015 [Chloroflexi bacterium]|nr:hypothetical protein [Chloroflexota bacterium]